MSARRVDRWCLALLFVLMIATAVASITVAGTSVSAALVSERDARSRFLHQASRWGTKPRDRANTSSV